MRPPARLLAAALLPAALLTAVTGGPVTAEPVTAEPGAAEAGTTEPGTTEPGTTEPGTGAGSEVVAVTADGSTVRGYDGGPSYVVDPGRHEDGVEAAPTADGRVAARRATRTAYPLEQTFRLHSLPGARRTVFLDVDGAEVRGTWWNEDIPDATYGGLDADGAPGSFNAAERAVVQEVWQRVAEDFAPFAVDVTTEDPGPAALRRASGADEVYGVHVVVTRSTGVPAALCGGGCVGVAFIDVFDRVGAGENGPAWAFSTPLRNDPVQLAETVSHEVGHTLGLEHDGVRGGEDYYRGHGVWSPLMGAGHAALTQWSRGEYDGAVNTTWDGRAVSEVPLQDDLALIRSHGLPARVDDHGGTAATATPLTSAATGVVSATGEVDAFTVQQGCAGPLSVAALGAPVGPNLDVRLRVLDADGRLLAVADPAAGGAATDPYSPADGLDAVLELASAPAGALTVLVDGVGAGDPRSDGYSAYASLGAYTLSAVPSCAPGTASAPTSPRASYDATTRAATLRWADPASPGDSPVTGWSVRRVGAAPTTLGAGARSATFTGLAPGTHEVAVAALNASGAGTEARASIVVPRVRTAATRPGAPTRVRAAPGARGGAVTFVGTWRAAASATPLTRQRVVVQRLSPAGRVLLTATVRVGGAVTRLTLRAPRGRYRLRVVALNAAGASAPSAWSPTVPAR